MATSAKQGPLPILQQFLANQVTYATDIGGGLVTGAADFVTTLNTTSAMDLEAAATQLQEGDVTDGFFSLADAVYEPLANLFDDLNAGFQAVVTAIVTHLSKLGAAYTPITQALFTGFSQPPFTAFVATGEALQNVLDALSPFNPADLVNALLAAPAVFLDGALNGTSSAGVLSLKGPIGALLTARNDIATAIDPPAAAKSTIKTPVTTVTLNVAASSTPGGKTPTARVKSVSDKAGNLGLKHQGATTSKK